MKAAFVAGDGKVELKEVPIPRIDEGEVLVRMEASGICGTDIEKVRGKSLTTMVLGHEVAGRVEKVGKSVKGLEEGDRVFVHHHVSCGTCYYCINDSPTMCELFLKTNLDPCGFAELFRVPEVNVSRGAIIKLPEGISFEEGCLVEPLACCLRALMRFGFRSPMSVMVAGVGPVGIMFVKLLKTMGASLIIALDIKPFRLKVAKKIGADIALNALSEVQPICKDETDGRGVDIAIVATSNPQALDQAMGCVRKGGIVGIFGSPEKDVPYPIKLSDVFIKEISIIPSYSTSEKETNMVIQMLSSAKLRIGDIITHRFKLEEIDKAFKIASSEDALKVILTRS